MDAVNNENQQGQRKIIYVGGGSDEEYMGGDSSSEYVNTVHEQPRTSTITHTTGGTVATDHSPTDVAQRPPPMFFSPSSQSQGGGVGGSMESPTSSMTSANVEHQELAFNTGGSDENAPLNHSTMTNNDLMYGGAKKKKITPDNSDNEEDDTDSDDDSAASSISTTQLLSVDPVYFRLTKFLTCTDYNGETKNVTNVLNDILTEFKKMNIFLENISKK